MTNNDRTFRSKVSDSKLNTKSGIGLAAGVLGLLLGLGLGAEDVEGAVTEAEQEAQRTLADVREESAASLAEVEAEARAATEKLESQQEALVDDAVSDAVAAERPSAASSIDKAVASAVKKAANKPAPAARPQPLASSTDPHFGTCGEANAAGYGPYRRGADEEYGWYQDRDGDGLVCER
ncbi:excalibur calcium-binding domain-containing protein [Aeromicrobium sp. UC242_57]|uniref:excalibur calcium-binding domain-containing protein n=1 Tax=Aeromicrobium sp. UC242_57 TaxID=3374624 RepID=UPI0037AA8392